MINKSVLIVVLLIQLLYSAPDSTFLIDTTVQYCPAYGVRGDPSIDYDSTNFFAVWADYRNGVGIYGTRVNSAGNILDPAGIRIVKPELYQSRKPGIAFNGTQYIVVYRDNSAIVQSGTGIFGIRVLPDGTVIDTTGIALTSRTNCGYPSITFGDSVFFVVWRDDNDYIYGTRLSMTGIPLDPDGIAIDTSATAFNAFTGFDGTSFWITWRTPTSVLGARVSQSGTLLDTTAILIAQCSATRNWLKPSIASGNGQCLITWAAVSGVRRIRSVYGARVSHDGMVLDSGGLRIASIDQYYSSPSACFTGEKYFVAWGDYAIKYGVYGSFVSDSGVIQDSIPIVTDKGGTPAVVSDNTNIYTAWLEGDENTPDGGIYSSRISHSGTVIDTQRQLVSTAANAQTDPALASDGKEYLVVWQDLRMNTGHDIYGMRIDSTGTSLQPQPLLIYEGSDDQQNPAIAYGNESYLALWENSRHNTGISGAIITPAGKVSDTIINIFNLGHDPAVAFNGTHFLALWVHDYDFLYGALISESGTIADPGIILLNKNNKLTTLFDGPSVASTDSIFLAIWSLYSEPG